MSSIRFLRTFLAVAQHGTFSEAAEQVALTQAAVSFQMRALEAELGRELFDRGGRLAILNAAGRELVPEIKRLLDLYDHLKAPRLAALITAIGVSIILQNVAMMVWGRNYLNFPQVLTPTVFEIGGARMSMLQIAIVVIAALIMGALLLVVHKTRLGTAMRATAQNREVAGLMGVNINTVISAAFLIGSALAAIAGMMVTTYYGVSQYTMGFMLGLKAFTAAVLGGIGNLVGAMAGGLLLGIIESLGSGYIGDLTGGFLGSHYQDVFAFVVLVMVLIFRPSGLLGERVGDRA